MNVVYKPAGGNDIPLLLVLMKEFYLLEHLTYNPEVITASLKKLFSDSMFGQVWLINTEENYPAGYIAVTYGYSIEFHGIDALVDEFYIREDYRHKGIGKRTLEFVENYLAAKGIKAFHLEVDRKNITAQEIYRKYGFRDHDRYLLTKWITTQNPD
jgi:ribosomal protein S18 acetylase RimI-like enzyme